MANGRAGVQMPSISDLGANKIPSVVRMTKVQYTKVNVKTLKSQVELRISSIVLHVSIQKKCIKCAFIYNSFL